MFRKRYRKRSLLLHLQRRVFLLIFQCLPLFLPSLSHFPFSLCLLSLSLSLSVYLSLSLSLSLVLFLLSSFIVFHFFLPFFLCWLVSLLLFHAKKNIKIFHFKGCFHKSFLFAWALFVFQIPYSYLYLFLISRLWAPPHLTLPFFGVVVSLVLFFLRVLVFVFVAFAFTFVCFIVGVFLVFGGGGGSFCCFLLCCC